MLADGQVIESPKEKYKVIESVHANAARGVYKVKKESDGQEYILKAQPFPDMKEGELKLINDHMRSLKQCDGLVKYSEGFLNGKFYYSVQEYCAGGDVSKLLKAGHPLDRIEIYNIILDVCKSLKQLDTFGLFHRDIKPQNIVIYKDANSTSKIYKLCDYGEVRQRDLSKTMTGNVGTPAYQAREIVDGSIQNYDNKVDIWSLGTVFYELFENTALFDETIVYKLQNMIASKDSSQKNEKIDRLKTETSIKQLIKRMVDYEPNNRPTIDQVQTIVQKAKQYEILLKQLMEESVKILEEKQDLLENPNADLADYENLSQKLKECQTKFENLLIAQK